jgi:phytoene/squalene synthetase
MIDGTSQRLPSQCGIHSIKAGNEVRPKGVGAAGIGKSQICWFSLGLMCLKIFSDGDDEIYKQLKPFAMKLGSAFQKVNFLRDLKDDNLVLNRNYFPGVDLNTFDENTKATIINEIEEDFRIAYQGILKLPIEAQFGVYTAFVYYKKLLKKLKNTPCSEIGNSRIRVSNYTKASLLAQSFVTYKLKLV